MEPHSSDPCPSEASSISATSHQSSSDEKMNYMENNPSQELNLVKQSEFSSYFQPKNIVNNVTIGDTLKNRTSSTHELNLFNPPTQISSSSLAPSESSNEKKPDLSTTTSSSSRSFSRRYCSRKFSTSQALGGHQNAHKQVRKDEKRGHNSAYHDIKNYNLLPSLDHLNYYHPYSTYQPHHSPLYGGSSVNPLLNKTELRWPSSSSPYLFGNHVPSWSGVTPYEYRPRMENMQPQTVRLDSLQRSTSLFDRGNGIRDFLGGASSLQPTHNVDSGITKFTDVEHGQEKDASGLDLNLKL